MARMISLRQLSISVARALTDGEDAASRAALVKDLGTRFEQDSVELVADLIDGVEPRSPHAGRLRGLLATARLHSPLFTLRGGTNEVLRGVVAKGMGATVNELTQLVDDIGRRSFDARLGHRGVPDEFDDDAVAHSRGDRAEPADQQRRTPVPRRRRSCCRGLARHAGAVPIAETDLLAAWLAGRGRRRRARPTGHSPSRWPTRSPSAAGSVGTATDVPWPRAATVLLAARTADALHVAVLDDPNLIDGHNLAGEPRGSFAFDLPADASPRLRPDRRR